MFISRVATLLSATALAVGISTAAAGAAQATVTPQSTWNEITAYFDNVNNHRICVDDTNGNTSEGNPMQLTGCKASASNGTFQRWHFAFAGNSADGTPAYYIFLNGTNKCITDFGVSNPGNGVRLTLGDCGNPNDVAYWGLVSDPNLGSLVMLRNVFGTLCMAAGNMNDTDGTPLIEKPCNPSDLSQQFSI